MLAGHVPDERAHLQLLGLAELLARLPSTLDITTTVPPSVQVLNSLVPIVSTRLPHTVSIRDLATYLMPEELEVFEAALVW
jgi:hypothetical protein